MLIKINFKLPFQVISLNHVTGILGADGEGKLFPAGVIYATPSPKYSIEHPPPKNFIYAETPSGKFKPEIN